MFGILTNGRVTDLSPSPTTERVAQVAALFEPLPEGVGLGWTRDENGAWFTPDGTAAAKFRTSVTRIEFKTLFGMAEHVQIRLARSYEGDDTDRKMLKITLDAAYDILDDPQLGMIDLTSGTITQFVGALVAAGILTQARAAEILQGVEE